MGIECSQSGTKGKSILSIRGLYGFLAPRAYSVIIFSALFCTLAVKFFHSWRLGLVNEYFGWILADIAVLLVIEAVLATACLRWPGRLVFRVVVVISAVVCTWSVINAGWLIRTGTQILPAVLLPLFRDPLNALRIIGVNLVKMPAVAVILLAPSAVALIFFFSVLAKPSPPDYSRRRFAGKIFVSAVLIFAAVLLRSALVRQEQDSARITSAGMCYNCQMRAVTSFFSDNYGRRTKFDLANAKRKAPAFDQIQIELSPEARRINHNVVIVVLEGVQYNYTSLADSRSNLTPYLAGLAEHGVEFTNARSTLTHTTKALFGLLTGRFPSASQDLAEAVPAVKPYAGIATILKQKLDFRTAFFQSAKGDFESRPGLVYNLGFDKFWAREDLNDTSAFLGYLACDEFSMLRPIVEWIKADIRRPFLLTILCSVTHDPYEVPEWFAIPAREPTERYRQSILYTDKFLAALDAELVRLNLADKTIFCVIGDHGEAFAEHGLLGHERIPFEEVLRIPFCLRAPFLAEPAVKITEPVCSVDLTPTLLALLGFETGTVGFDGADALGPLPGDRKVYFSGLLQQSPAGFVRANRKFIYNPANRAVSVYDLNTDPLELVRAELPEQQAQKIADEIVAWRKNSIFKLDQQPAGEKILFGTWLCKWHKWVCSARYCPGPMD